MDRQVEYLQFKRLLESIENTDVLIRLRSIGESWTGFSKVILASENALMFEEGVTRRVIMNLRNVIEFEISQQHSRFVPKTQYLIGHG